MTGYLLARINNEEKETRKSIKLTSIQTFMSYISLHDDRRNVKIPTNPILQKIYLACINQSNYDRTSPTSHMKDIYMIHAYTPKVYLIQHNGRDVHGDLLGHFLRDKVEVVCAYPEP